MSMSIPVEAGNRAACSGTFGAPLQKLLDELKPEAAFFTAQPNGQRGGFIVFDLKDVSDIPGIAEPFFLLYNASVSFTPVMTPADLAKAGPGIEKAVKVYGSK